MTQPGRRETAPEMRVGSSAGPDSRAYKAIFLKISPLYHNGPWRLAVPV